MGLVAGGAFSAVALVVVASAVDVLFVDDLPQPDVAKIIMTSASAARYAGNTALILPFGLVIYDEVHALLAGK
ncbi:MAG: hypothetical protein WA484_13290 [Solirubrobacteraceae bacterium]